MRETTHGADHEAPTLRGYLTGFVLALVLTFVAFGGAAVGIGSKALTLSLIAAAGVAQILVHLRYFLHLSLKSEQRWNTLAMAFSALILLVLVGGTIWLFVSLKVRMM